MTEMILTKLSGLIDLKRKEDGKSCLFGDQLRLRLDISKVRGDTLNFFPHLYTLEAGGSTGGWPGTEHVWAPPFHSPDCKRS